MVPPQRLPANVACCGTSFWLLRLPSVWEISGVADLLPAAMHAYLIRLERKARQLSARRFNAVKLIPNAWLARATVVFDDVLICFSTSSCRRTLSCSETWALL